MRMLQTRDQGNPTPCEGTESAKGMEGNARATAARGRKFQAGSPAAGTDALTDGLALTLSVGCWLLAVGYNIIRANTCGCQVFHGHNYMFHIHNAYSLIK